MDRYKRSERTAVDGEPEPQAVSPINLLLREQDKPGGALRLQDWVTAIRAQSISDLLIDVKSATNPTRLWLLHVSLDARDVPPCLRPAREDSHQMLYLTWLADILWFAKRLRGHKVKARRHRALFQCATPVQNKDWHDAAIFAFNNGRTANGFIAQKLDLLGLSDQIREQGLVFRTPKMIGQRKVLAALPEYRERMVANSLYRPDRSGCHTPEAIADRRIKMLRCFVLAGKNATIGNRYFQMTTGEVMTRQTFRRHIDAAYDAVK